MRNLALVMFASVVLASQAQAQIGVRTILDYGGGNKSTNAEGKTQMNLTPDNAPEAAMRFLAEEQGEAVVAAAAGEEQGEAEPSCGSQAFSHWLPTGSETKKAQCFWMQRDQEYGRYTRFTGSDGDVAAATEIISDVIYGARVYVTTAVSSQSKSEDETADDVVSRNLNLLAASGGNLAIATTYPVYARSLPGAGGAVVWNVTGRAGSTLQQLGISPEEGGSKSFDLKDFNGNLEGATEFQVNLLSAEKKFNIQAYAKLGGFVGTKKFADALGADNRNFWHHELGIGVRLADLFSVLLTWNEYSDDKIAGDGAVVTVSLGR
jgi:hypothetical protein